MPLMKRKSNKAFEHNIKAEMHAGKPQPQALAIAYSVKRKAKKASGGSVQSGSRDMNMAEGGSISASNEKRPMTNDLHDDKKMASQNRHMRDNGQDGWLDRPTEAQAKANDVRGKKLPIKRPRMVPTDAFSTRLYDEEGQLEESARPGPYGAQPPKHDDEEGPNRQGPKISDMQDEHSTHRKPYAKGGEVEAQDYDHKAKNKYEDDLLDLPPSHDEGAEMARHDDEEGQDRQGPAISDMEDEHSTGRKPYAGGGRIGDSEENIDSDVDGEEPAIHSHSKDDSEDQPQPEEEEEHYNSIAAAIMARRDRLHAEIDSGAHDLDEAVRMAEGGEILEHSGKILSHGSMDSDDSDQADLSRNHDEDANEEDQASWNSLRKENYNDSNLDAENPKDSAQHGDEEEADSENKHDMISSIRRKMRMKRQFSQD